VLDAAGWIVAWNLPADQKPAALKAVAEAVGALPEGTPLAQLQEARDRTIQLLRDAPAQRQRKEQESQARQRRGCIDWSGGSCAPQKSQPSRTTHPLARRAGIGRQPRTTGPVSRPPSPRGGAKSRPCGRALADDPLPK
jgi:hypothetical protein